VTEALAALSPQARSDIDAAQPWHDAEPSRHPLAVLVALSNADKHRRLNVVTSNAVGAELPVVVTPPIKAAGLHLGPITPGFELQTVLYSEPQTEALVVPVDFAAVHRLDEADLPREDLRELAPRLVGYVEVLTSTLLQMHL